jgi:CBS domain-containing protein
VSREFDPLPIRELGAGAGFRRPTQSQAARVALESPALHVMTDLARVAPAAIRPDAPLNGANQFMITRGVRLLLVVDEQHESVLGVITANDLLGERALQMAASRGLRMSELQVADVMTPAARVEALALADVESARVGHVLETLRRLGRQHVLVIDAERKVRGILSLSQIARQLGLTVASAGEVARTFAEIEAALAK